MSNRLINRRQLIKNGILTAAGLALVDPARVYANMLKPKPFAKSVIQIWMWGGPSHIDTFDPKPDAGKEYTGPLDKPIGTNIDGIQIGQLLPQLAKHADKYSIVRSMTHGINAHETASYRVQTGRKPGRLVYPSAGAIVSKFKGYESGYKGLVPPYIVLTKPQGRFSEAGFLGPGFKPFATGGDPGKDPFIVEGIVAKGITDKRQYSRRKLLESLDTLGSVLPDEGLFLHMDECKDKAYNMMFGDARKLFDLTQVKKEVRQRYGINTFGQSCLMAKRLVEYGVPYVTINYRGWDTHKQHFEIMNRKLPEMDKAMASLFEDLSASGLLDSTIVWWGGEFGRSPRVKWDAPWNGGRGHFGRCFSSVLAGGGFKGGQVVGSSDEKGENVASRPVDPQDFLGSIYQRLGIDPDGPLPNTRGLDLKVTDVIDAGVGRLEEIM